jgi:flagellar protein FlaJ
MLLLSGVLPLLLVMAILRYFDLSGFIFNLFYLFPAFGFLVALLYPFVLREREGSEMDWKLPPLVIHMGVLASSGADRLEMLREISQEKEFGPLAREFKKVYRLVKDWNIPLHKACEIISKDTPSRSFKEFLRRLSHSIESGEDFEGFLRDERDSVIKGYELLYQRSVKSMDSTQEFFAGMMASASFVLVLMAVLPPLLGINPLWGICVGLVITIVLEILVIAIVMTTLPKDDLWSKIRNRTLGRMDLYMVISITAAASLTAFISIFYLRDALPTSPLILVPLGLTPLLLVGLKTRKEEKIIKEKEDEYPSFVRSTCSSFAHRRGTEAEAISDLRRHDFGPLTKNIKALYRRLRAGINARRSWSLFSSDIGSSLISRFNKITYSGIRSGADPAKFGDTISSTFVGMNGIRKMRYSAAATFSGLIYGLGAAVVAVFALSVGVGEYFANVLRSEGVGEAMGLLGLPTVEPLGQSMIEALILAVVLTYAISGAIAIKISSSSHTYIFFLHFPAIVWLCSLTSLAMIKGLELLMGA